MAGLLSSSQLTAVRAQATASLDRTCVISTPGAEVDDLAGGTTAGSAATVSVACRVATPTGSDQKTAERLGTVFDVMVTLPHGTVIDKRGSIAIAGGPTYQIVWSNSTAANDEQSYQTAVRVGCRRVA